MKNILWFSRHTMTNAQLNGLRAIYGEVDIKQVTGNASSAKEIVEAGEDCENLAVVLPPSLLADITNQRINTKPVIRSVAAREFSGETVMNPATGKEEPQYKFVHQYWELVKKVEVITEKLG